MQVFNRGVRSRRLVGAVPLVSVIVIGLGAGTASAGTSVYATPGAEQTFVVPAGVTPVAIDALGAQGGDAIGASGGRGGEATGPLVVMPGQTLRLRVGGRGTANGGAGYNGGGKVGFNRQTGNYRGAGGGGASDLRTEGAGLVDRVLLAPGGGSANSLDGGAGGGVTGGNGVQFRLGAGGLGGTPTTGGAAGAGSSGDEAFAGTLGDGGDGTAPSGPLNSSSYAGAAAGGGGDYNSRASLVVWVVR